MTRPVEKIRILFGSQNPLSGQRKILLISLEFKIKVDESGIWNHYFGYVLENFTFS